MNYDSKEFGMRITKLRSESGKTQQEIADLLHTSLDNYRGIEKGRRNPSLDLLVALSSTLNATLDYLILGRTTLTDSQCIRRELENIVGKIRRLKRALRDLVREGFLGIEERQRKSEADSSNTYRLKDA